MWGSHHPLRHGMSGRTECGKPSVTIAHRGIFTPTLAFQESIDPDPPHLAASNARDCQADLLSKTMSWLPGARVRDFTRRGCFFLPSRALSFSLARSLVVTRPVVRTRSFSEKEHGELLARRFSPPMLVTDLALVPSRNVI